MKRRQKELGLYNVCWYGKKAHQSSDARGNSVQQVLRVWQEDWRQESHGSKLALLLRFLKILHIPTSLDFIFPRKESRSVRYPMERFLVLTLFNNLRRVFISSRPVELLSGGNAGEREPKSKLFMAIAGLAVWEPDIWQLLQNRLLMLLGNLFFIAVLHCLLWQEFLISGIYFRRIVILKLLRRRKKFYYKLQNFTSVSRECSIG